MGDKSYPTGILGVGSLSQELPAAHLAATVPASLRGVGCVGHHTLPLEICPGTLCLLVRGPPGVLGVGGWGRQSSQWCCCLPPGTAGTALGLIIINPGRGGRLAEGVPGPQPGLTLCVCVCVCVPVCTRVPVCTHVLGPPHLGRCLQGARSPAPYWGPGMGEAPPASQAPPATLPNQALGLAKEGRGVACRWGESGCGCLCGHGSLGPRGRVQALPGQGLCDWQTGGLGAGVRG